MKRSIVKILLQIGALGVAVMLVFLVLPGIQLVVPSLLAFFILGLLLGLLYTFVRPVLVAITGRLLIATMGLFLIILNFIIFVLLIWLFPGEVIVSEPKWLWVLLASVLIALFGTLFESLLGLNRPELDDVGRGQMLWRVLDTLPTPRRSALIENLRIQQVYETVMSYGLDIAISRTPLKSIREWVAKNILRQGEPGEELSTPAKVRMMLQELGPTYVKFGQIVSSQAGTLPKDWEQELAKLQSTVPPFPSDEARAIIQQELKHPVSELYATFEDKPLAAASTAQVHRATLADGTQVVVKVQRPRILAQTKADLGVLQQFGGVLAKRFRFARALDLGGMLNEFAAGVLKELDYNNEAYQAQRLNDNLQSLPDVRVPTIFRPLSTSRVMTMDYVEGVKVTNVAAIKAAGLDCAELSDG